MRLTDCYIEVVAFVKLFLRHPTHDYDEFRARVDQTLETARQKARSAGTPEECESALFAVVAWLDEAVLCSQWDQADRWKTNLLQKIHFNTTRAGVEFFTRLDALPHTYRNAREVYYTCLLLGFRGQYVLGSDQLALEMLTRRTLDSLVDDANNTGLEEGAVLFPLAYANQIAPPPQPARFGISTPMLTLLIVPLLVLGLLYVIFDFVLNNVASGFLLFLK